MTSRVVIPETVRSELGKGRIAVAMMVSTSSGWRFLSALVYNRNLKTRYRLQTAWSLAGAHLFLPDDPELQHVVNVLEERGREFTVVDVAVVGAG